MKFKPSDIRVRRQKLPKWKGEFALDTYGGKQILNNNKEPVFAEIYALRYFEEKEFNGVWIDNYRRRLVTDMTLKDMKDQIDQRVLNELIRINGELYKSGTWDLMLWKEDELKFVELKRVGTDKLRDSQIGFYKRAIEKGYKSDQFEIFEWDIVYEIESKNRFPVTHKCFYDRYKEWREEMMRKTSTLDGIYILYANRPIHRLTGVDENGVLYIGKGKNIINYRRIGNLINSINETDTSHSGGIRLNPKMRKRYPIKDFEIEVQVTEDYTQLESQLLNEYFEEYGELPPLNRVLT